MEIYVQYPENDDFLMSEKKDDKIPKLNTVQSTGGVERLKVANEKSVWLDDALFEEKKRGDSSIDSMVDELFEEEKKVVSKGMARRGEDEINALLDEKTQGKGSDMEVRVRKALSGETVSRAERLRLKSATATDQSLDEVLADTKGLEEKWEDSDTQIAKTSKAWKLGLWLLSVLVCGLVWAVWQAASKDNVEGAEARKQIELDKLAIKMREETASNLSKKAERAAITYIQAATIEEKLSVTANAEEVRPFLYEYYQKVSLEPNLEYIVKVAPAEVVGQTKVWLVAMGNPKIRGIDKTLFVVDEQGEMKVDWEADVCWQRDPLKNFLSAKKTVSTAFRVRVKRCYEKGLYNWGFTDEEYRAVKLYIKDGVDPNSPEKLIWGYVRLNSKEHNAIDAHQDGEGKSIANDDFLDDKMMVEIRFLEGTSEYNTDCVLIEKVVSPRWIDARKINFRKGESDE